MKRWNRLYLEKAKKAGIEMKMYERYVDDSNQVAKVPPHGFKLDKERMKLVSDHSNDRGEEKEVDERLAKIQKEIANSVIHVSKWRPTGQARMKMANCQFLISKCGLVTKVTSCTHTMKKYTTYEYSPHRILQKERAYSGSTTQVTKLFKTVGLGI